MKTIGVIGGGAWGTALANIAARAGRSVTLWAREPEVVEAINSSHTNPDFLPDVPVEPSIRAVSEISEAVKADAVLLVAPAQAMREVCTQAAPHWPDGVPAVICAKGVEKGSLSLLSEVVRETLPQAVPAILSGPTFAMEAARGQPTAATLACEEEALGLALLDAFGTSAFRPYWSDDVIGAQVGGAVKNVLAIACGVIHGKGLGDNPRAALLTRGLAELARMAVALGGRAETVMGLSGMGDLLLTATSLQSRNFSLGYALGQGQSIDAILGARRSVTEGVFSAEAVCQLAARLEVDVPICEAVNAVINGGADLDQTIQSLLSRPLRAELDKLG